MQQGQAPQSIQNRVPQTPQPTQPATTQPPSPNQQQGIASPQHLWVEQARQPEQVVRSSTLPPAHLQSSLENLPTARLPGEIDTNQQGARDVADSFGQSPASIAATSRAAEHWRNSWRDRQRAEAGPATKVSRGQASVPEPLLAMQKSFVRMRAIIMPGRNKQNQQNRATDFRFWMIIFLMVCLIGGLATYVVSTYLPNARLAATVAPSGDLPPATLTIQGSQEVTVTLGQSIQVHGEHFGANDLIAFLFDSTTPITDANGQSLSVQTNSQGTFNTTVSIGSTWTGGAHLIQALDNRTHQSAYLNIQVEMGSTPITNSDKLELVVHGKRITSQLAFNAVVGQPNPNGVRITLTNITATNLRWSVIALADDNLGWLTLDKANTLGILGSQGEESIGVSVIANGLQSRSTPYSGRLVFTINGTEQLTLPVQLQVRYSTAEMVVSPNPVVGILDAGGTCQSGLTLTLINLGNDVITWDLKPVNAGDQGLVQFNGKPEMEGQLNPTGQPGDTMVLNLACTGVHVGQAIPLRVGYNGLSQTISMHIRT